jgi:NADPH:quinone reductase-like Zn-dependent oxidoreductase
MSLPPSKIIGCDFSGEVSALGSEVPFNSFSVGDRVAGVVHGCKDSHTGAFAETLVADANMCFKLPSTATKDSDLEAACTLGVGWISAAQALRQRLYKDEKTSSSKEDTVSLILKSRRGNKRRNVDSNGSFSYTQPPPIQACMQYSKPASTFPLPIS